MLAAIATASVTALADGKLEIVPTAATATVTADGRGRRTVPLPALRYDIQLLHSCSAPMTARSLSVTIADSHHVADAGTLDSGNGNTRFSVTIPEAQLAPVILSDFCTSDADVDGPTPTSLKTLPALLSASAALRCADDGGERTTYAAAPLDVVLICDTGPPDPDPGEDAVN